MATATQAGPGQITGNVLFYSNPEPLSVDLHKGLGVKPMDGPFKFAKAGHAVPLTVTEFALTAVCMPIIFVGEEKTPLAVMGLNAGQNMFLQDNGMFEPGVYVPAYIRRYPFVFANDSAAGRMILCIDRAAEFIIENGEIKFFNEDGSPTEYTQNCINFCNDYEQERGRTESFVELLKELDLFDVRKATFTPPNPDGTVGEPQTIAEYFAVSEDKLNALPAEKLVELRDNGALGQIYAHLTSLVGCDRLVALAMARAAAAQPQAANA
jgi:hypothetical protein